MRDLRRQHTHLVENRSHELSRPVTKGRAAALFERPFPVPEASSTGHDARWMVERFIHALVRLQTQRSGWLLGAAILSVAIAALGASRLTLKTSFGELLPQNKESVVVAD